MMITSLKIPSYQFTNLWYINVGKSLCPAVFWRTTCRPILLKKEYRYAGELTYTADSKMRHNTHFYW